ncbi:MAG TPA: formylglycine-generating enzyme family protein, partial [Verrucomicrobiae bacterium]
MSAATTLSLRSVLILLLVSPGWVVTGATASTTSSVPETVCIVLKNGDRLSGRLLTDPLRLATNGSEVQIHPSEVVRLGQTDNGIATVRLINGDTTSGRLSPDEIALHLDIGPQLAIPTRSIVSVSRAGETVVTDLTNDKGATTTNLDRLIWLPPGRFVMGSPSSEAGRDPDEGPQTEVTIAKGFWMGKCEVTQAEYQKVMGNNPSAITDDPTRPVERVSWFDAVEYCKKLTQLSEAAGWLPTNYIYRLPTEAEWEYACRAGTTSRSCCGDNENETHLDQYAWFS